MLQMLRLCQLQMVQLGSNPLTELPEALGQLQALLTWLSLGCLCCTKTASTWNREYEQPKDGKALQELHLGSAKLQILPESIGTALFPVWFWSENVWSPLTLQALCLRFPSSTWPATSWQHCPAALAWPSCKSIFDLKFGRGDKRWVMIGLFC